MKPFQIAFWAAALAGGLFFYQLNQIGHLNEEWAVYCAQVDQHNSFSANSGSFVRSFFDGLTFGAFADEGIFTEAKKSERETTQLTIQRASIISRYGTATYYRNFWVIVMILMLLVGFVLKRSASFQNLKFAGDRRLDNMTTVDSMRPLIEAQEKIIEAEVVVPCNNCGQKLRVPPSRGRTRLRCRNCDKEFYYPA